MPLKKSPALLCLLVLEFSALQAQEDVSRLYRAAATIWYDGQTLSATRPLVPLEGTWRATCAQPALTASVQVPGAYLFEGEVRFERTFRLDPAWRDRPVRLHVHGLNHEAQIALNGETTASHMGGYAHAVVELRPENLRYDQENLLGIAVDNRLAPLATLPPRHRPLGWRNHGGLTREIHLEVLPEIFLAHAEYRYDLEPDEVVVEAAVQVRHRRGLPATALSGLMCSLEIWDPQRNFKLAGSPPLPLSQWQSDRAEIVVTCRLPAPIRWSPATPVLYNLRLALQQGPVLVDELWQPTGFRTLARSGQDWWLNGEPLVLRGVDWIEDYGNGTALLDSAALHQVLQRLQHLGVNALRVVGHPPHPMLPALCDRAGIFLLEELPLYYLTDAHYVSPRFAPMAQMHAGQMIRRDRLHPSVLAWGLGVAGAPTSPAAQKVLATLVAEIRQRDDRPVYVATLSGWQELWEPHVDVLLVAWPQRPHPRALAALLAQGEKTVLPVLSFYLSAAEAAAPPGSTERLRAEEAQAEYYSRALQVLREAPRFAGYFLHTLQDWEGPMPLLAIGPPPQEDAAAVTGHSRSRDWGALHLMAGTRLHPFGLVDRSGQRRHAFRVVETFNRGDAVQTLVSRPSPPQHPGIFQILGLALIVLFLFLLRRDRRLRGNLRRVFVHPHGFYLDLYENRKVPPFLTLVLGLAESCIAALLLAQFTYAYRQHPVLDQGLNLLLDHAALKAVAIWLIWHPGWFVLWATLAFFILGAVLGALLRVLGFFMGSGPGLAQYVTSVYWACANVLPLGLLAPIFYRMLLNPDVLRPVLVLLLLMLLWLLGRLFRAMRVLYMISHFRTAVIFVVVFGGMSAALMLYFDRSRAWFDYLRYYLAMLTAMV